MPPPPPAEARGLAPVAPHAADRVERPAEAAAVAARAPEATTPREPPALETPERVRRSEAPRATLETEAATPPPLSPRERDETTSRRAGSRDAPSAAPGVGEAGREATRVDETAPRTSLPLERESDPGRDTLGPRDARPESQTGATGTAPPLRPASVAAGSAPVAPPVSGAEATARSEAPPLPVETAVEVGVPGRVEWLAQRGGGAARLRLHPPELGELNISVRVRGNQVDVQIQAEQPAALHLVSESRERLVDALAARDLRVDHFELRGGDDRGAGSDTSRSPLGDPTPHGGGGSHPDPRAPGGKSPASAPSPGNAPAVTAAPMDGVASRGVDLRV